MGLFLGLGSIVPPDFVLFLSPLFFIGFFVIFIWIYLRFRQALGMDKGQGFWGSPMNKTMMKIFIIFTIFTVVIGVIVMISERYGV